MYRDRGDLPAFEKSNKATVAQCRPDNECWKQGYSRAFRSRSKKALSLFLNGARHGRDVVIDKEGIEDNDR